MTKTINKKTSIFTKFLMFVSIIFAILLVLSYLFPFFSPRYLKSLASLSLYTPFIILINILLMLFWGLTLKRIFWVHFFLLLIGYNYISRFYKIASDKIITTDDVKVMSYNVRMFNKYEWSDDKEIPEKIKTFINDKSPDIVCFQDYAKTDLKWEFPYKYEKFKNDKSQFGQAIFSKFPIINKGSLDFEQTANNIIFADVVIDKDTIRIYNIHLQSIKLNPKKQLFGSDDVEQLQMKISKAFQIQQEQVQKFAEHQSKTHYSTILCGDFNNTAYSWVYRELKKGKKDAFTQAGAGFGKTYDFEFPMRIDFIFADKQMKINHFKTYKEKYSDHFPILTRIDKKSIHNVNN